MTVRSLGWIEDTLASVDGLLRGSNFDAAARGRQWMGAAIDSRGDCARRVFFAIRGERADGHRYAAAALEAGGIAAVIEDENAAGAIGGAPCLLVRSTVEALQELARAYRAQLDARVVAITGSAGKTTTKEYVRAVMRTKYRVHSNPGNYNSLIGVPLTVLEAKTDCQYLVSEVGANASGEVDFLAARLRPDVGVITNIGDAHVGHFGSSDAIARAKGELLDHIPRGGTALLPHDDDYAGALRERARCRVLTFGGAGADYELGDIHAGAGRLDFSVNGSAVSIRAIGAYNAVNACAAFAVGEACGVEPERIRGALESVVPMPGRGRVHERGGAVLVDESYNASPSSMMQSLSMLAGLSGRARRIAVLGDMKELGAEAAESHRRVGRHLAGLPVDVVWWIGGEGGHVGEGIKESGGDAELRCFSDVADAVAAARGLIHSGDAVLVKASRSMQLDRFVADFLNRPDEAEGGA